MVNVMMEVITLGFYRPWSKSRNRQYFYAHTMLDDRNFEYHASGRQLFLGYVIGVILFMAYAFLDKLLAMFSMWMLVFAVIAFFALPWIIWKSIKFNARVTSFSGIHFGFDGSFWEAFRVYGVLPIIFYACFSIPFYFLSKIIAGSAESYVYEMFAFILVVCWFASVYAFGFMQKRMNEYKIGYMKYGISKFSVDVTSAMFMRIALWSALVAFVFIVGFLIVELLVLLATVGVEGVMSLLVGDSLYNFDYSETQFMVWGFFSYLIVIAGSSVVISYWKAKKREYVYENTRLDDKITFNSTLTPTRLAYITITNYLMILASIGFAYPAAKLRMARVLANNTTVAGDLDLDSFIGERQKEESALGDQIGDVFDVDFDVGF